MNCDLHVHTVHSGLCEIPLLDRFCRESYSEPAEVYSRLKSRGMDLVTVTDHDSIDAAESLRRHADFFLSEELSCVTPNGTRFHMGVYDLSEHQHVELQQRRADLTSLLAYLDEQRLPFSVNHVFSSLTGARKIEDFAWFESRFPLVETLNGQMPAAINSRAERFAEVSARPGIGGSDAHTMHSLARSYTRVPGARTKEEFLNGLRAGRVVPAGESGGYWKLTRDILSIIRSVLRRHPAAIALAPLIPLAPVITLLNLLREHWFAARWESRTLRTPAPGLATVCGSLPPASTP